MSRVWAAESALVRGVLPPTPPGSSLLRLGDSGQKAPPGPWESILAGPRPHPLGQQGAGACGQRPQLPSFRGTIVGGVLPAALRFQQQQQPPQDLCPGLSPASLSPLHHGLQYKQTDRPWLYERPGTPGFGGGGGGRGWGFKCRKSADHTTNSKGSITGFSHPSIRKEINYSLVFGLF